MIDSYCDKKKSWFFVIICMSSLYNFGNSILRMIGMMTLLIFIVLIIYKRIYRIIFRGNDGVVVIGLIMLYAIAVLKNVSFYALRSFLLAVVSIACVYYFSDIDIKRIDFKTIRYVMILQCVLLFIPMFMNRGWDEIGSYQSFFSTTTFLGDYSTLMIEISFLCAMYTNRNKLTWYLIIMTYFVLLILSRTRTPLIGLFIIACFVLAKKRLKKRKSTFYKSLSMLWILVIIGATVAYVYFDRMPYSQEIQLLVFKYTHKPLLSGREIIWKGAIEETKDSFLFGLGYDYRSKIMYDSVHNSYIDVYVFGGIITLTLSIIFIVILLNRIRPDLDRCKYYCYACCLANLLTSVGEVMLFRGQSTLQIIIWSIIGLGINNSLYNDYVHRDRGEINCTSIKKEVVQ